MRRNSPSARRHLTSTLRGGYPLGQEAREPPLASDPIELPIPHSVLGRNIGRKEFKMFEIVCPQLMTGASGLQPDRHTETRIVRAIRDGDARTHVFFVLG